MARAARNKTESPYALAALRLLIFTGCHRDEILNLRWDEIDFGNSLLRLPETKTGSRVVYLSAPALEVLSSLPRQKKNPHVIVGQGDGRRLVNLRKVWLRVCKVARLKDVRIHDLRHSFASVGAAGGVPLQMIGKLLGHSKASTTEKYSHLAADPVKAVNEAMDRQISAMLTGDLGKLVRLKTVGMVASAKNPGWGGSRRTGPTGDSLYIHGRVAAHAIGTTERTMESWHLKGVGPAYVRMGGRLVRYKGSSLLKYADGPAYGQTPSTTVMAGFANPNLNDNSYYSVGVPAALSNPVTGAPVRTAAVSPQNYGFKYTPPANTQVAAMATPAEDTPAPFTDAQIAAAQRGGAGFAPDGAINPINPNGVIGSRMPLATRIANYIANRPYNPATAGTIGWADQSAPRPEQWRR